VGAPVVPDVQCEYIEERKLFLGKAFDNRIGCSLVVEAMKNLKSLGEISIDVAGVLSSQEEVGTRGAVISSQKTLPDLAIVLEAPPADDTFRNKYTSQGGINRGVQIRHIDPTMIANPRFVKFIKETAKKYGIKYQETVRESGGTNAGKIHLENLGIPTVVLGVPVRYAHSHHGFLSLNDYEEALKLVEALLKDLNEEIIKSF
uniref:M20/M25/M40 family metallo-hydrolase n=1 Tax=Fusobacterium sp. TaxID=68766 RepID=UPI00260746A3